ncbi:MAG: carboxy terminal-processing peptidase, partial [Simkaniaceae bacterium]|nr:carboxy terminal-processing peptidase [Simkaniaceae bacterium]
GDDRTYGKGSMQYQTLTNASAKSFFKVTVGRYYTASGKSPQINGVKADIVVPTVFSPYNIGERFLEFPLTNDHLDRGVVTSMHSLKLKSNKNIAAPSVPYLQPRDTDWRKMLGKLKSNSKERLSNDKNFNYFLKVIHGKAPSKSLKTTKKSSLSSNFGKDDLQMKEAVHIIQDMIQIHVK